MKKAKSCQKNVSSTTKVGNNKMRDAEKKIERLELLAQAQDLEHFTTKMQALNGKLQQLQTEANMANRDLEDIKKEGQKLFAEYNMGLVAFKTKYNVPDDKEVNLRTGELVDPQPPPQQQQQEVPLTETEPEKAS